MHEEQARIVFTAARLSRSELPIRAGTEARA